MPAAALHDPALVRQLVERLQDQWGGPLEAVASQWHKHYGAAVLTGPLLTMTVAGCPLVPPLENAVLLLDPALGPGRGLPAALVFASGFHALPGRDRPVSFRPAGPARPTRPTPAEPAGPARRAAAQPAADGPAPRACPPEPDPTQGATDGPRAPWMEDLLAALLARFLAPVVSALHRGAGVPPATLWTNTANFCASLYEELAATGPSGAAARDAAWLLTAPALGGFDPNPLAGRIKYAGRPWGELPARCPGGSAGPAACACGYRAARPATAAPCP